MAIVDVNYSCGCGFNKKSIEEAVKHVDNNFHVMTVSGVIKPSERRPLKTRASSSAYTNPRQRAARSTPVTTHIEVQAEQQLDFNKLKARLQGRR